GAASRPATPAMADASHFYPPGFGGAGGSKTTASPPPSAEKPPATSDSPAAGKKPAESPATSQPNKDAAAGSFAYPPGLGPTTKQPDTSRPQAESSETNRTKPQSLDTAKPVERAAAPRQDVDALLPPGVVAATDKVIDGQAATPTDEHAKSEQE